MYLDEGVVRQLYVQIQARVTRRWPSLVLVLQVEGVFAGLDQGSEEERVQRLLQLKLRYFTPREVANLMGFPPTFCKSSISSLPHLKARVVLHGAPAVPATVRVESAAEGQVGADHLWSSD